jgi:hypothetical protein
MGVPDSFSSYNIARKERKMAQENIKHYITTDVTKLKGITADAETANTEMLENLTLNVKASGVAENKLFLASINLAQIMQPRINAQGNNDRSIPVSKDIAKIARELLKESIGDMEIPDNKLKYERLTNNINLQARATALLLAGRVWVGHYVKTDKAQRPVSDDYNAAKHQKTIFGSNTYPFNAMSINGVDQPKIEMDIALRTKDINDCYEAYFTGKELATFTLNLSKGNKIKVAKGWKTFSRNTQSETGKARTMIADLKKFWDTQIVLGENFKGFDPKNATYGDLKTDEQPFGVEGYILDESSNKNVQRPIMTDIAIELETFSNDLQKRVAKLKELLELERANLEDTKKVELKKTA